MPRKPKAYAWLWRIASLATQRGLLQVSWCPSHGKRPELQCEPPFPTTNVARGLNDLADKGQAGGVGEGGRDQGMWRLPSGTYGFSPVHRNAITRLLEPLARRRAVDQCTSSLVIAHL